MWQLFIAICKYCAARIRYRIGFRHARLRLSPAQLESFAEYAAFLGRRDLLIWLQNGKDNRAPGWIARHDPAAMGDTQ